METGMIVQDLEDREHDAKLRWHEAVEILKCGKDKFYRLVYEGKLPAYKSGKKGMWVWESDCRKLVRRVEPDAGF